MKRTLMFILALALLASVICEISYAQCPGGNCSLTYGWNSYGYGWFWPQWNYQSTQTAPRKCTSPACMRAQAQKEAEETVPATADDSGEQTVPETPVIEDPGTAVTEPVSAVEEGANPSLETIPSDDSAVEEPTDDSGVEVIEFKPFCVRVAELVNQARARYGLPPFTLDQNLCNGCGNHSAWMASYGFQHASNAGAMECIAMGVSTPEAVVNMWMNSSGHRAIILSRGRLLGVGAWGTFWTLRVR